MPRGREIAYALHDFEAENPDELSFKAGEIIHVIEKDEQYGDGWWQGENASGATGLFPGSYTSPTPPVPSIPANFQEGLSTDGDFGGLSSSATEGESTKAGQQPFHDTMNEIQSHIDNLGGSGGSVRRGQNPGFGSSLISIPEGPETDEGEGPPAIPPVPPRSRSISPKSSQGGLSRSNDMDGDGRVNGMGKSSKTDRRFSEADYASSDESSDDDDEPFDPHRARARLAQKATENLTMELENERKERERKKTEEEEMWKRTQALGGGGLGLEISDESGDEDDDEGEKDSDEGGEKNESANGEVDDGNEGAPEASFSGAGDSLSLEDRKPASALPLPPSAPSTPNPLPTRMATASAPPDVVGFDLDDRRSPPPVSPVKPGSSLKQEVIPSPALEKELESQPEQKREEEGLAPEREEEDNTSHSPLSVQTSAFDATPKAVIPTLTAPVTSSEPTISQSPLPLHPDLAPSPIASEPAAQLHPQSLEPERKGTLPTQIGTGTTPSLASLSGFDPSSMSTSQTTPGTTVETASTPTPDSTKPGGAGALPVSRSTTPASSRASYVPPTQLDGSKKSPAEWSVEEVVEWGRSKGFDEMTVGKFQEHEISGDVLLEMDVNTLKEIDLVAFGRRVRVFNGIKELKRSMEPAPASTLQQTPSSQLLSSPTASVPSGYMPDTPASSLSYSTGNRGSDDVGRRGSLGRRLSDPSSSKRKSAGSVRGKSLAFEETPKSKKTKLGRGHRRTATTGTSDTFVSAEERNEGESEADDDSARGVLTDGDARRKNAEEGGKRQKKLFDRVRPSSSSISTNDSEAKVESSPRPATANAATSSPSNKDNKPTREKSKGGFLGGTFGRTRKPPPRYSIGPDGEFSEKEVKEKDKEKEKHKDKDKDKEKSKDKDKDHVKEKSKDKTDKVEKAEKAEKKKDDERPSTGTLSRLTLTGPRRSTKLFTFGSTGPEAVIAAEDQSAGNKALISPPLEAGSPQIVRHPDTARLPKSQPSGSAQGFGTLPKNSTNPLAQIGEPDFAGWLKKKGQKYNTWKTRYLILKGVYLYYLKSEHESKIKGYINLTGYKFSPDPDVHPGHYGFRAIHETEPRHFFSSNDPATVRDWMKGLMKATIGRDFTAPVVSSCNIETWPISVAQSMFPPPRPPSPTSRARVQRARYQDPSQLSAKDAAVLKGFQSDGPGSPRSERDSFLGRSSPDTALAPPKEVKRPSKSVRRKPNKGDDRPRSSRGAKRNAEAERAEELLHWMNSNLPTDVPMAANFTTSLQSGKLITRLLEALSRTSSDIPDVEFDSYKPQGSSGSFMDHLDTLFKVFDFIIACQVSPDDVSINDMVSGNETQLIKLVGFIRDHYS